MFSINISLHAREILNILVTCDALRYRYTNWQILDSSFVYDNLLKSPWRDGDMQSNKPNLSFLVQEAAVLSTN